MLPFGNIFRLAVFSVSLLTLAVRTSAQSVSVPAENPGAAQYDVIIRNGRVLDGAGNPSINADIAIKDGLFAKIGHLDPQTHAKTEIDARGRYVSPGWIDVMDQSGHVLPKNGLAENKLMELRSPPNNSATIGPRSSGKASASTSARTIRKRRPASRFSPTTRGSPLRKNSNA